MNLIWCRTITFSPRYFMALSLWQICIHSFLALIAIDNRGYIHVHDYVRKLQAASDPTVQLASHLHLAQIASVLMVVTHATILICVSYTLFRLLSLPSAAAVCSSGWRKGSCYFALGGACFSYVPFFCCVFGN